MSQAILVEFRNGIAEDCTAFQNSYGGAVRIWDSIWKKYGTPKDKYDSWMNAADDGRLWKLWNEYECEFSKAEEMVYLFTCDFILVAKEDFQSLALALREFVLEHPAEGVVCHLNAWADMIESSTADAIGLHATTVTENPWCKWDEEKDESIPYDFTKGNKHEWLGEVMKETSK